MVNNEKDPIENFRYQPGWKSSDNESVCQGIDGHKLCDGCSRYKPGLRGPKHYLSPPARDNKTCSYFRRPQ